MTGLVVGLAIGVAIGVILGWMGIVAARRSVSRADVELAEQGRVAQERLEAELAREPEPGGGEG